MTESGNDAPVWAREEAFPEAPEGYGWVDRKGRKFPCGDLGELIAIIGGKQGESLDLVWTPECQRMLIPEQVSALLEPLEHARLVWARDELKAGFRRLVFCAAVVLVILNFAFSRGIGLAVRAAAASGIRVTPIDSLRLGLRVVFSDHLVGIAILLAAIFGFIPWYQGWKRLRAAERGIPESGMAEWIATLRFETWLDRQRAPVTSLLLQSILVVGLLQLLPGSSIMAAGLVKNLYRGGQLWRLLTSPLLHGNPLHFLLNAGALLYLGRRVEIFARWPHLALSFLFSAWVGGETSAWFSPVTMVGASGGIMGLLGFLLVFETLHSQLVPVDSRRRLLAGLALTLVVGLIGFRYIDNAAHVGGMAAGMAYAAIVFPKSSSPHRPDATKADKAVGWAALLILGASVLLAVTKMLAAVKLQ